jgi:hypothetical protein
MRIPLLTTAFCVAAFSIAGNPPVAFGQQKFDLQYTSEPTPALLKNLQEQLAAAPSETEVEKMRRVDLAIRIIQVDLLLGDKGSQKHSSIGIQPAQARKALAAMEGRDPAALNDLKNAENRKRLWDAIASAHPAYRLYVEAVRLAGHIDDRDVLERTLHLMLYSWSRSGGTRPLKEVREPLGAWGRDVICDCLRIQAIDDVKSALSLTAGIPLIPESTTKRPRLLGNPPAMSTRPFPQLRASGNIATFDLAAHRAAALQRAGKQVTLWSVAAEKSLNPTTKSIGQEPLIVFPEEPGKPALVAVGADEILSRLKGERIATGIYRFAVPGLLGELLAERGQYLVVMAEVLNAATSPAAWAAAAQKTMMNRVGARTPRELLFDLPLLDPWAGFALQAASSLGVVGQSAFVKTLQRHSIRLCMTAIKDGMVQPAVPVPDILKRDKAMMLPLHEAAIGRAFHMLPGKFIDRIETIQLQPEPIAEKRSFGVQEGSRIVVRELDRPLPGRGWSNRFLLALPSYTVAVHELTHCWAFARQERFQIGAWEGTVVTAFNEISWVRAKEGPGWTVRGGVARTDDFVSEYAATNEREDLAVTAEFYVTRPKAFRDHVRAQWRRGNLTPAVKYLFMKHVAFLDADGRSLEYETDAADPPFSRDEFNKTLKAIESIRPLTDEQKRLLEVAERIQAIADDMVKNKRIVRRELSPPKGTGATGAHSPQSSQRAAR